MRTLSAIAYGLTCLLGLTTPTHAAPATSPQTNHGFVRYEDMDAKDKAATDGCTSPPEFKTLVFVECLNEDRPKFASLIKQDFPDAKELYTDVNQHVPEDLRFWVEAGVRQYYVRGKYDRLVIISSFRRPNLGYVGESGSAALKRNMGYFSAAKENDGPRLVLLSTQKDPPSSYLNLVKASGGSYRMLKQDSNGNFN
jgi:hypothetical protein